MAAKRSSWAAFQREHIALFEPGQHISMIGPTGRGKSTLALHLLQHRPYVVVLDAKGGDDTLNGSGFEVVNQWPIPNERERLGDGKPIRLMLRPKGYGRERLDEAHDLFSRCIQSALDSMRWTIYVDELRLTSEGRTIDLAPEVEVAYMVGRGRRVTMVSATQAPRYVPKAAYDQVTHQFHWPLGDRDARRRQAEISGLDRVDFDVTVEGLAKHEVLYISPMGEPLVVKPPAPRKPVGQKPERERATPKGSPHPLRKRVWGH
jgi:hypothetical protein